VIVLLCVMGVLLAASGAACVLLVRRLLTFDDLFEMLVDEIDTNIRFLESFEGKPLVSNAPEVIEVDRGMKIMKMRLEEYVARMRERDRRPKRRDEKNRPWVV
jgi:hypothetical protein